MVVLSAFIVMLAGCRAARPPSAEIPRVALIGEDRSTVDARATTADAALTVFVFFSPHCHCLDAHERRLRALVDAYGPRGVRFLMIDSEAAGSPEADRIEAKRRGYSFPILSDQGAKLADALGAEYATFSVIADANGRIRYRGGLDSDKVNLHDNANFYLQDALTDLLAGRPPRVAEGKTLGCTLKKD